MEAPSSTQGPKADLSQRSQEMRVLVALQGAASGCSGPGGVTAPSSRGAIGSLMSPRAGRQDFRSVLRGKAPAEQGAAPQPAGSLAGGFQYPGFCPEGTSRSLLLHPCLVLALRPPLPQELAAQASKRMCHCQADSDPLLVPPLPTVQQTPH